MHRLTASFPCLKSTADGTIHKMKSKLIDNSKDYLVATVGLTMYIFGVAGNSMVVIAVWKKRSLRSTTNYLLVNLAISDIVSFLFLPLILVQSYAPLEANLFADFLCKFFISFHVPVTANVVAILTVTLMSVERYHALVKPMKIRKRLRKDTVGYAIATLWISGLLLTLPYYIFGNYDEDHYCVFRSQGAGLVIYEIFLLAIIVFIPFFITSFCYFQIICELYIKKKVEPQNVQAAEEDSRAKHKLVKLSLSITLVFGLFMFPLFITMILKSIDRKSFNQYFQIASVFFFLEAAVNPFIYTFQSTNFRQAFKEILKHPCSA